MTSTDLVCAPTSSSPATRLVPSLPAAAQPSRHILLLAPLAAGGDLAIGAELDVPTPCPAVPCCLRRCQWQPCLAALDAASGSLAIAAGAPLLGESKRDGEDHSRMEKMRMRRYSLRSKL
ncbi:hypothetical protein PVAP13_1NG215600 [Panicum virgatum]|uniref:Uncharacterized protein n=1 Tax=Panicum virgatum TaxID=38727 RepID=A0A8T0WPB9_PANVG|nr:hypothetical protein PVAP13_1NG215600 [Panicum virgatum]